MNDNQARTPQDRNHHRALLVYLSTLTVSRSTFLLSLSLLSLYSSLIIFLLFSSLISLSSPVTVDSSTHFHHLQFHFTTFPYTITPANVDIHDTLLHPNFPYMAARAFPPIVLLYSPLPPPFSSPPPRSIFLTYYGPQRSLFPSFSPPGLSQKT